MKNEKILKGMLKEILLSVKELNTKLNALLVKEEDNVSRKDAYASLYEDGDLQMKCGFENPQDLEQFCYLKDQFELDDKDALDLIKCGIAANVRGVYKDTYDIGKLFVRELTNIPYWLDNDQFINYAKISEDIEDMMENSCGWYKLPSGNYADLRL